MADFARPRQFATAQQGRQGKGHHLAERMLVIAAAKIAQGQPIGRQRRHVAQDAFDGLDLLEHRAQDAAVIDVDGEAGEADETRVRQGISPVFSFTLPPNPYWLPCASSALIRGQTVVLQKSMS